MSPLPDTPAEDSRTSVVIVNYRTKELARAAVQSVLAEPRVGEVVVVDNASGDGSTDFLRRAVDDPRVRIVESSMNRGFGPGVNLGVAQSTLPLVLVLNSDAALRPGSLEPLIACLTARDDTGLVAPAVYAADGRTLQWGAYGELPRRRDILLGRRSEGLLGRRDLSHESPEWVSGAAMLIRRVDFEAMGGFDERFEMYFEDLDLCRRLRAPGSMVRRCPEAAVVHRVGGSWQSDIEKRRRFHASKLVYYEKLGASRLELHYVRMVGAARLWLTERGWWRPPL
ncbi:MAG: glycosyltransferase family 2 protein [Actinomycetota bacterium]|nr:glycosyltransferase family 2 protein [Actinomycetota bacterium]